MNGFKRQALLITLLDALKANGSWCGETHIQKSAYFLSEGIGVPLDLEFVLYKHGPFSFELREVLGEMRGNFLIDLESHLPYGPSLVVSESGRALAERFPNTVKRHASEVNFIATELGSCSVTELERLSTALYARLESPESPQADNAVRINELKPHISIDLAGEAVAKVEDLLKSYR